MKTTRREFLKLAGIVTSTLTAPGLFLNCQNIINDCKEDYKSLLSEKVKENTREDLLLLSALFHDIGKKETLEESCGKTRCPNHEMVGSRLFKKIASLINLSSREADIVSKIIEFHAEIHKTLDRDDTYFENSYKEFQKRFSSTYVEQTILGLSDSLHTSFEQYNPKEYSRRKNLLVEKLI